MRLTKHMNLLGSKVVCLRAKMCRRTSSTKKESAKAPPTNEIDNKRLYSQTHIYIVYCILLAVRTDVQVKMLIIILKNVKKYPNKLALANEMESAKKRIKI